MKTLLRWGSGLLVVSLAATGCENRGQDMGDKEQPRVFATVEQAAEQAKNDLVKVLRGPAGVDAGVDAATVERSRPGQPVRRVDVSFEKLLSIEPGSRFDALASGERSAVVPLLVGTDVVTVVEVRPDDARWRVAGLAGKDIADELNQVRRSLGDQRDSPITLYDVPNLQARVYGVKRDGGEVLFTNYGGRFSLREGVEAAALVPALKADAVAFQTRYGELLKKERLLR